MLLKIIGAVLTVFASFSIGCILSKKLYRRRDFLNRLAVFISTLSTNLRYNSSDIFTMISLSADSSCLSELSVQKSDKPFDDLWNDTIELIPKSISLTKQDYDLLAELGFQLGKTDIEGQLKHLELCSERLKMQISDAEDCISNKSKLYKTMGFFVGASAAILLL